MYYILFYKTIDNYLEKRIHFREEHLKLAREAHIRGELLMAGAMAEPTDSAVLIFKGNGPEVAEQFAANDPYVQNGLIREWEVRPWTVVIGDE
ncbi:MAG: YciI family protein [Bacteroidales bacterium]|nr:YciI family protein [Bacteroidales bacterium]